MAFLDLHHALEIMKTAFPYMDSRSRKTIDLFIKVGDLYECLVNQRYKGDLMANSIQCEEGFDKSDNTDIVGMLKKVRDVCHEDEIRIIDSILDVVNAMELYETYTNLYSMMNSQDDFNGINNLLGFDGDFNNTEDLIELLSSILSPEDKETIENINMVLKMMNFTNEEEHKKEESEDDTAHNL